VATSNFITCLAAKICRVISSCPRRPVSFSTREGTCKFQQICTEMAATQGQCLGEGQGKSKTQAANDNLVQVRNDLLTAEPPTGPLQKGLQRKFCYGQCLVNWNQLRMIKRPRNTQLHLNELRLGFSLIVNRTCVEAMNALEMWYLKTHGVPRFAGCVFPGFSIQYRMK